MGSKIFETKICTQRNLTANIQTIYFVTMSRDRSVGIGLDYGMDDRCCSIRYTAGAGNFSLQHRVKNGSGAHGASYPMRTRGCFPGGDAAGAWSWPLTSTSFQGQESVELYLHSPNMSSWRRA